MLDEKGFVTSRAHRKALSLHFPKEREQLAEKVHEKSVSLPTAEAVRETLNTFPFNRIRTSTLTQLINLMSRMDVDSARQAVLESFEERLNQQLDSDLYRSLFQVTTLSFVTRILGDGYNLNSDQDMHLSAEVQGRIKRYFALVAFKQLFVAIDIPRLNTYV